MSAESDEDRQKKKTKRGDRISLHPLEVEDALRGAMATGGPPELPKGKRTHTKRRLKGEAKTDNAKKRD